MLSIEVPLEVPASLKSWVRTLTRVDGSGVDRTWVRLPDAGSSLVICEAPGGATRVVAVGPTRRAFYKSSAPSLRFLRVGLQPGLGRQVLGASPRELTDGMVDLETLWAKDSRKVTGAAERGLENTLERLTRVVAERLKGRGSLPGVVVRRAAALLEDGGGDERVHAIAARLRVSERFLRNAFREELGVSPKRYARIERIRRVAESAASESTPWARLAASHGFFDQAHLNAEFRDLLGATPTAFRAGTVPASSNCGNPPR